MLICIDSCVFIRGLSRPESDAHALLYAVGSKFRLVIPRLIALEVSRNLTRPGQVRAFYRLFVENEFAFIVDHPVPRRLVERYMTLGLAETGDAVIGAFAEWLHVDFLISDNRHFLRELRTDAYGVLTPGDFLTRFVAGDAP